MVRQWWRKMPGKHKSVREKQMQFDMGSACDDPFFVISLIRSVVKPVSMRFCGMPRQRYLSLSNELSFFVLLFLSCARSPSSYKIVHSALGMAHTFIPQLEILHFNSILFCCQQQQTSCEEYAWERMLRARVVIYVLCRVPCVTVSYLFTHSTYSIRTRCTAWSFSNCILRTRQSSLSCSRERMCGTLLPGRCTPHDRIALHLLIEFQFHTKIYGKRVCAWSVWRARRMLGEQRQPQP